MSGSGSWGKKMGGMVLAIGIAMLFLVSVALADGGLPPPWWDNPGGYGSWRRTTTDSGSAWVDVFTPPLVVSLTVPNEFRSNARKDVWMQVEWTDAPGDNITLTASMTWSYDGCEGPWEEPVPLTFVDAYTPSTSTDYKHGAEFAGTIDPQPACELITVTFHDVDGSGFTIRYNIEVQTLCFDKLTSAKVVDAFVSPLAALPVLGLALGGLIWRKRRRR